MMYSLAIAVLRKTSAENWVQFAKIFGGMSEPNRHLRTVLFVSLVFSLPGMLARLLFKKYKCMHESHYLKNDWAK